MFMLLRIEEREQKIKRRTQKKICIFRCDGCGIEFEGLYAKRNKLTHFHSLSCINKNRNHSDSWKQQMSERMMGSSNHFFGRRHSTETKKHLSEIRIGRHLTESTKIKLSESLSGERNPFFGRTHDDETKQKMSLIRTQKIASGKLMCGPRGLHGEYESCKMNSVERFDSFFERIWMILLDNDENVISWTKKHGIIIPYKWKLKKRRFVPDFRVETKHGIEIHEIKGYEDKSKLDVKIEAMKLYCSSKGFTDVLIRLSQLEKFVMEKFGCTVGSLRRRWKKCSL